MIATAQAQVMFGEDFEGEYEAALEAYVEKNPDAGMTALPAPDIALEDQANKSLRAVKFWRKEQDRLEQQVKDEVGRLQLWLKTEQDRLDRKIRWHEDGLHDFLVRSGKKSIKLAYGVIKWVKGRDKVEVLDMAALEIWAQNNGLGVRVKREADKLAIAKHIKETGEIPDGTDLVAGEDTFTVDTKD
uniref:Putative host-nuclease inhibitor protein n=1 Tax=viral metagenome TaxID=1070528 RepID=A0A6M3KY59_9ZZZZ